MKTFVGRNVCDLYQLAMFHFKEGHDCEGHESRNGEMLEFKMPVTSVYQNPTERVLFDETRDANPFLHFFESLWMLEGRNDLDFLTTFTKNMENFSDDGETLNGAYGHRWRHHFRKKSLNEMHEEVDQIDEAINELITDPMSRRVVIQMWDGGNEDKRSKDIPCNTSVMFRLRNGKLDMTVTNRSNDAIWGCYGANAVHFSFLHEYIASSVGAEVGIYRQVSNSLHIYPDFPVTKRVMHGDLDLSSSNPYSDGLVEPYPLFGCINRYADRDFFDSDMYSFFTLWDHMETEQFTDLMKSEQGPTDTFNTPFFRHVVAPMWVAHATREISAAFKVEATDWRLAAVEWLERRKGGAV